VSSCIIASGDSDRPVPRSFSCSGSLGWLRSDNFRWKLAVKPRGRVGLHKHGRSPGDRSRRLVRILSYLPQILLGLFGLYYGARWLLAKARIPDASQVDPEERLYRATMRLSETPTGVLTAGIVYAGLLSTTSVILSFVLPILVRSGFSLSPRALVLNLSYIFGMAFQVVIFYYWFALLQRAPYSVDHWRASRFEYATQKNALTAPDHSICFSRPSDGS